jgi:thiamine transporter ThiT
MAFFIDYLDKQPKWLIFVIGLILVAILGYIDYLTGEYSLLLFYCIPIFLVSWYVGCWQGILIAVLSGTVRFITDSFFVPKLGLLYWNSIEDTLFLMIIAVIIFFLRRALGP